MKPSKIFEKRYAITTTHKETQLSGTVVYWSKDYRVILEKPVYKEGTSTHMMYMLPARFTTPLDTKDKTSMIRSVDIVEDSKKKLKILYDEVTHANH
ncbi:hypothetical protein OAA09_01100 [bacterium]|nr:hypothetical protein [bacterium]